MKEHAFRKLNRAFTLLELLVTMILLAVLVFLIMSTLKSMRERGWEAQCVSHLKQIGAATAMYAAEHQNELPYYHYQPGVGQTGSGSIPGTWFYNLAPYLSVPRTEVENPAVGHVERTQLGTPEQRISKPCVFTCPGHRRTETNQKWQPEPMTFPALAPVSYAPATTLGSALVSRGQGDSHPSGHVMYALRYHEVESPGQKIWLCDSPLPHFLNISAARWQPPEQYADNFPYQGFTRHNDGGNALFYDGHVEHLLLTTFTEYPLGIAKAVTRYFHPFRHASLD